MDCLLGSIIEQLFNNKILIIRGVIHQWLYSWLCHSWKSLANHSWQKQSVFLSARISFCTRTIAGMRMIRTKPLFKDQVDPHLKSSALGVEHSLSLILSAPSHYWSTPFPLLTNNRTTNTEACTNWPISCRHQFEIRFWITNDILLYKHFMVQFTMSQHCFSWWLGTTLWCITRSSYI